MGKRRKNKWAVRRTITPKVRMTQKTILSSTLTNPNHMARRLLEANLPTPQPRDYSLRMDNLSTVPRPPTAIEDAQYEQYLRLKAISQHRKDPRHQHTIRYYTYRHGPLINKYYFISPTNYEYLVTLARKYKYANYVKYMVGNREFEGNRNAGISSFIRELASPDIEWLDTRDEFMKELDQPRIEQGLAPMWTDGPREDQERRTLHKLAVTQDTEDTLYKLALSRMIINRFRPTLDKTPVVGFLLEVIGQGYLTPTHVRINPAPRIRKYRIRDRDYGASLMLGEGWQHD